MASFNCILLAAGFSRRFGGNKLLTQLEGKPLWRYPFDLLLSLKNRRQDVELFVVSQYEEILQTAAQMGAEAIRNPAPERGISSSMKLGAEGAVKNAPQDGYLVFFVADQPQLSLKAVENLFFQLEQTGKRLGALSTRGEAGNPVAFGVELLPELMELTGDRGGKPVLLRHLDEAVLAEVPQEELYDIDTKGERDNVFLEKAGKQAKFEPTR
jgi:CTP:molybdopterin cytidylyltransferase MocA